MSEIEVQCYSGSRSDERPLRFCIRGRNFDVKELDGQWYSPDAIFELSPMMGIITFFTMMKGRQDSWTLDGFRAARKV
jgi:hypothetical protein